MLDWSLQWRHNGRDSVSNHKPRDCLLNRLFRRRSKKTSKLRVTGLCAGNSPGNSPDSPHKWPVTRKMLPFDDVIMFKVLWPLVVLGRCTWFWAQRSIVVTILCRLDLGSNPLYHSEPSYEKKISKTKSNSPSCLHKRLQQRSRIEFNHEWLESSYSKRHVKQLDPIIVRITCPTTTIHMT